MQTDVTKVFYFHADANSLGGFLEDPFRVIRSQASVSLPSVGGYASTHEKKEFEFEDVVKCRSTYTHVAGRPLAKNGPWVARVTAVVEGLDIKNVLTAERIVARIFVSHPADGGAPTVSFAGSHFHKLRYEGEDLPLNFNPSLLPVHDTQWGEGKEEEAVTPEIQWPVLWDVAQRQASAIGATPGMPPWAVRRYGWLASQPGVQKEGYGICSLVDRVGAPSPASTYGHFLDVPDVGRFFFTEAMILPQSIQLTMIRAELGCKTTGQVSVATARTNGVSYPP